MSRLAENNRWRCKSCDAVTLEPDLLTAPSPFDPTETLYGCPQCKQCGPGYDQLCDEIGCGDLVCAGVQIVNASGGRDGYRLVCGKHAGERA